MNISFAGAGPFALTVRLLPGSGQAGQKPAPGQVKLDFSAQAPGAVAAVAADYDRYQLIKVFAKAVALCRKEGLDSVAFDLSAVSGRLLEDCVYSAGYACRLADYSFDMYLSKKADNHVSAVGLAGVQPTPGLEALLREGDTLGRQVCLARDLANTRSHQMTPTQLAKHAQALEGVEVEVLWQGDMEALGMGGLLAVSQGAHHPPAFIIMRYRGNPASKKVHGIVGKGITYDSGGLSLKSKDGMITMHGDMGGAAATIAAMGAIAAMGLEANVTAVVPACENMLAPQGYRPGDIITMLSGKTVIIKSTDAEGRLVMADAMTWLAREEKADSIIDAATLTGAAAAACGPLVIAAATGGGFCPDILDSACKAAGNMAWRMPMPEDYKKFIKDDHADLSNSTGGPVGMIGAALFLQEFTQDLPWLHLDIAGTSKAQAGSELDPPGATGIGTALLYQLVKALA